MFFVLIVIFLLTILYLRHIQKHKDDPPGPKTIPLLGILPTFIKNPNVPFFIHTHKMGQKYGDIFSYYLGMQQFIVLNSYPIIKEAMIGNPTLFMNRPTLQFYKDFSNGFSGVALSNGEKWRDHRRFTLRVLRNFGLGKKSLEPMIIREAEYLESLIDNAKEQPIQSSDVFVKGISNIISLLVFGTRWSYDDSKFVQYVDQIKHLTQSSIMDMIPILYPSLTFDFVYKRVSIFRNFRQFRQMILDKVKIQQNKYNLTDDPSNIVECYLQEKNKLDKEQTPDQPQHTFDIVQTVGTCADLIVAGTDTTTVTLSWAILLMAIHPEIQNKLHEELDAVVPRNRPPNMTDKTLLSYAQAVIDEVARYATIVPLSVEKQVVEDVVFKGYTISKSAIISTNLYSVHRDPKLWKNPNQFDPNHFLTSDGKYQASEYMIAFGIGKRACLGESLAQMELFLFFTYIMQRFYVELDPKYRDNLDDILQGSEGDVHSPQDHRIIFKKH